jgi:hypothetical protein
MAGTIVFTGSRYFEVEEIEVFEILYPFPNSEIISNFPRIFAEFQDKTLSLLWRGSRDGFDAEEFHDRCDGHANTLTVILDTNGNIFGGFTPVEWESHTDSDNGEWKADDSLKSFLFTLKNPHNIPARRFALHAAIKHQAIGCHSGYGPVFGGGRDIAVWDKCNTNTFSYTVVVIGYTNNTLLNNNIVFTGSQAFQCLEIEVFEITN